MSFHDVQFPTSISYGSSGGPSWSTSIIETDSGQERRIARWSYPRYRYNVNEGVKTMGQLAELVTFYLARQGAVHSFRYKDWFDFTSAADNVSAPTDDDQQLGTGDGSTVDFQIVKRYTSGVTTRIRTITKIVDDTLLVAINGSPTSAYTYDGTTGVITFDSAPTGGQALTCGFEFDVHVRFGAEADEHLAVAYDGFEAGSIQSIPLVEVMEDIPVDEDFLFGGVESLGGTTAIQLTATSARVLCITPGVADLAVKLPSHTSLPYGGPYYWVHNLSGSNALVLKTSGGTTILSVAANSSCAVMLGEVSAGTKKWFALTGTSNA